MTKKITFELPEQLRNKANRMCEKNGISMAELLRDYLTEITKYERKAARCGSKSKC